MSNPITSDYLVSSLSAAIVSLTARELQILQFTAEDMTADEIAVTIGTSKRTVEFHFANINAKFAVRSKAASIAKAIKSGLI